MQCTQSNKVFSVPEIMSNLKSDPLHSLNIHKVLSSCVCYLFMIQMVKNGANVRSSEEENWYFNRNSDEITDIMFT